MDEHINAIQDLENKYSLMTFRMALTHLVDVGVRNLSDENVEEAVRQINANEEEARASGGVSILTAEFQIGIVRCAAELAKFSISDLFYYIKQYVDMESR